MSDNITRPKIQSDPNVPHMEVGYDTKNNPEENLTIPSCNIEDVDMALHKLFDEDIGFTTKQVNSRSGPINIKKPTVFFASGERYAIAKKLKPIRDDNNSLMLPLISIRRTSIEQNLTDIASRGINQTTGEFLIKRKLSSEDRNYQSLVNKLLLKNVEGISSDRERGEQVNSVSQGGLLENDFGNNIFEMIAIPQPQFYTAVYEVIFWANYTENMNYLLQKTMLSFLPQAQSWKLVSPKKYWFIAYVDESFSDKSNSEDFNEQERLFRYSFNVRVQAYLIAGNEKTNAVPIRRWFSSPQISFDIKSGDQIPQNKEQVDKYQLNNVNDLPELGPESQKQTNAEKYVLKKDYVTSNGRILTKYVQISDQNKIKGETVYSASDLETMSNFLFETKR